MRKTLEIRESSLAGLIVVFNHKLFGHKEFSKTFANTQYWPNTKIDIQFARVGRLKFHYLIYPMLAIMPAMAK